MNLLKNKSKKARSPTLQTVLMVEEFIEKNSGEYKKTELFKRLPKKVMWQTFQIVIDYLVSIKKIAFDRNKRVVYIWNPEFYNKIKDRPDIRI